MNLHEKHKPLFVLKTPWFNWESPYVTVGQRRQWALIGGLLAGAGAILWWAITR